MRMFFLLYLEWTSAQIPYCEVEVACDDTEVCVLHGRTGHGSTLRPIFRNLGSVGIVRFGINTEP